MMFSSPVEIALDALGLPISRLPLLLFLLALLAVIRPDAAPLCAAADDGDGSAPGRLFPVANYHFARDDLATSWVTIDDPSLSSSSSSSQATAVASAWAHAAVGDGRIVQTAASLGPVGAAHRGTVLRRALSGGGHHPAWGDATFRVRLGFGQEGSGPGDAGVVFRVVDDATYYRVFVSLWSNMVVFDRFVHGVRVPVESGTWDAARYVVGSDLDLTVRASGPRITVFLAHGNDGRGVGAPPLRVIDTIEASFEASARGTVGVFTSGAAEASFDFLRVAPNPPAVLLQEPRDGLLTAFTGGAAVTFSAALADCDPTFPLTASGSAPDSGEPIPGVRVLAIARGESAALSRTYSEALTLRCHENTTVAVQPGTAAGVTTVTLRLDGADAALSPWATTGGGVASVDKRTSGEDALLTTSLPHGLVAGDRIMLVSMPSVAELDGRELTVGVVTSATSFTLDGVDAATYGDYYSTDGALLLREQSRVRVTVMPSVPSSPTMDALTGKTGSFVRISWRPPTVTTDGVPLAASSVTGYVVHRTNGAAKENGQQDGLVLFGGPGAFTDATFTDYQVQASRTYTYRVRAICEGCGTGQLSGPMTATTTDKAAPSAPRLRVLETTGGAALIGWDEPLSKGSHELRTDKRWDVLKIVDDPSVSGGDGFEMNVDTSGIDVSPSHGYGFPYSKTVYGLGQWHDSIARAHAINTVDYCVGDGASQEATLSTPSASTPSAPVIDTNGREATGSSVAFQWARPLDNGGRPLTGYYGQYRHALSDGDGTLSCDDNPGKFIRVTSALLAKWMGNKELRSRSSHPTLKDSTAKADWFKNADGQDILRLHACPEKLPVGAGDSARLVADIHLPFKFSEICAAEIDPAGTGEYRCKAGQPMFSLTTASNANPAQDDNAGGKEDVCSWGHPCVTGLGDCSGSDSYGWVAFGPPTGVVKKSGVGTLTRDVGAAWPAPGAKDLSFVNKLSNVLRWESVQPCASGARAAVHVENIDILLRCEGPQDRSVPFQRSRLTVHCSKGAGTTCGNVVDNDLMTFWNANATGMYATDSSSPKDAIVDLQHASFVDRVEIFWETAPLSVSLSISDALAAEWTPLGVWDNSVDTCVETGAVMAVNAEARFLRFRVAPLCTASSTDVCEGSGLSEISVWGSDLYARMPNTGLVDPSAEASHRFYDLRPDTIYDVRVQGSNTKATFTPPQGYDTAPQATSSATEAPGGPDAVLLYKITDAIDGAVERVWSIGCEELNCADAECCKPTLMPAGTYDLEFEVQKGTLAVCGWADVEKEVIAAGGTIENPVLQSVSFNRGDLTGGAIKIEAAHIDVSKNMLSFQELADPSLEQPLDLYPKQAGSAKDCFRMDNLASGTPTAPLQLTIEVSAPFNALRLYHSTDGVVHATPTEGVARLFRRNAQRDLALTFGSEESKNEFIVQDRGRLTKIRDAQSGGAGGVTLSAWVKIDFENPKWLAAKDVSIVTAAPGMPKDLLGGGDSAGGSAGGSDGAASTLSSYLSCDDAYQRGQQTSGAYYIKTGEIDAMRYCEMNVAGGGWTLVAHQSGTGGFSAQLGEMGLSPGTAYKEGRYDRDGKWDTQAACQTAGNNNPAEDCAYAVKYKDLPHEEVMFLTGDKKVHCAVDFKQLERATAPTLSTAAADLPASCREIRARYGPEGAPSGAYWMRAGSSGAKRRLLMHCDMDSDGGGYSMYALAAPLNTAVDGLKDVRSACASVGLAPVSVKSAAHLSSIRRYVKQAILEAHPSAVVPIASLIAASSAPFVALDLSNPGRSVEHILGRDVVKETVAGVAGTRGRGRGLPFVSARSARPVRLGRGCSDIKTMLGANGNAVSRLDAWGSPGGNRLVPNKHRIASFFQKRN